MRSKKQSKNIKKAKGFKDLSHFDTFIQESLDKYHFVSTDKKFYDITGKYSKYLINKKSNIPDLVIYNDTFDKNECFYDYYGNHFNKYPRVKFSLKVNQKDQEKKEEIEEFSVKENESKKEEEKDNSVEKKSESEIENKDQNEEDSELKDKENENCNEKKEEGLPEEEDKNEDEDEENEKNNENVLTNPMKFINQIKLNSKEHEKAENISNNKSDFLFIEEEEDKKQSEKMINNKPNKDNLHELSLEKETTSLTFISKEPNQNKQNKEEEKSQKIKQPSVIEESKMNMSEEGERNYNSFLKMNQLTSQKTPFTFFQNQVNPLLAMNTNYHKMYNQMNPFISSVPQIFPQAMPLQQMLYNNCIMEQFNKENEENCYGTNSEQKENEEIDYFQKSYANIINRNLVVSNWFLMKNDKILGNFNSEQLLYFLWSQLERGNNFEGMSVNDYTTDVYFKPSDLFDLLRKYVPIFKKRYINKLMNDQIQMKEKNTNKYNKANRNWDNNYNL